MPQAAIAIVKSVTFRGAKQEFSNVYHYRYGVGGAAPALAQVTEIVNIEKDLHSTDVAFDRYAIWTSGGTKEQNQMIAQGTLSGTGNQGTSTFLDRERAVLMQWPAGLSSTGKPVYLRKWFHSCGHFAGIVITDAHARNTTAFTEAQRDTMSARANDLRLIGEVDQFMLVAESGREHTGAGRVHKWLEHRQLGDQWR